MNRRAALPGANELFRGSPSASLGEGASEAKDAPKDGAAATTQAKVSNGAPSRTLPPSDARAGPAARGVARGESTGRERHDEKITVYLSADELVQLDEAKATLYRDLGLKVDRGRIVREAVAVVIGDLADKGEASILARRLREP